MPPRIARGFLTPLRAECHPSRTGAHRRAKPETTAFGLNTLTDDPDDSFSAADLLPLGLREIVLHGGFLAEGQGFGPGEADGTAGYKTVLPVAAGVITAAPVPLPASVWLIAAALGGLGALRARRRTAG